MQPGFTRAIEMTKLWIDYTQLAIDTQTVMTLRLLGLSGAWSIPKSEKSEMFNEKAPAFTEAMVASALTAWSGQGPDRVMQAAIEPLSKKTRANRARLSRRGPRVFGKS